MLKALYRPRGLPQHSTAKPADQPNSDSCLTFRRASRGHGNPASGGAYRPFGVVEAFARYECIALHASPGRVNRFYPIKRFRIPKTCSSQRVRGLLGPMSIASAKSPSIRGRANAAQLTEADSMKEFLHPTKLRCCWRQITLLV